MERPCISSSRTCRSTPRSTRGSWRASATRPPRACWPTSCLEHDDGTLRYVDLWRSREECDRFTDERLHPVVGRALAEAGIRPAGEPPRREMKVVGVWGEAFPREARV